MSEVLTIKYSVDGNDFLSCGQASEQVKRVLKQLGIPSDIIRKVAIAMYEGEINMVIHADGGEAMLKVDDKKICISLCDSGPGIADIDKAMQEGFSTATDSIRELGFGAGMGLPNMRKYSDNMELSSEVGKGTKVVLEFFLN